MTIPQEWRKSLDLETGMIVGEHLRTLAPTSLQILQEMNLENEFLSLHRLIPYSNEASQTLFNEDLQSKEKLLKNINDITYQYDQGQRGSGSALMVLKQTISSLDELLYSRGIDPNYSFSNIQRYRGQDHVGIYIQCFNISPENHPYIFSNAYGRTLDRPTWNWGNFLRFEKIYLLSGCHRKIWLLVQHIMTDFSMLAPSIGNVLMQNAPIGIGYTDKINVSARKHIQPAKVNIKFQDFDSGFGIPFGQDINQKFITFEAVKAEIIRRLNDADLPPFKLNFTPEKIVTKGRR